MPTPYSGPKEESLRNDLARIVREGLEPYWISEVGGDLLTLEIVRCRVPPEILDDDGDEAEDAKAKALVAVLTEAVDLIGQRKYRRVLRYVLPIRKEYLGKPVKERRVAAGQNLKDGKKAVKAGTIRTHYEPKALDQLARMLVKMESEHRGEMSPWASADSD